MSIIHVLYITPHKGLYKALMRYIKTSAAEIPIGLVLWDDLRDGIPKVFTKKGEIDLFSQKDF